MKNINLDGASKEFEDFYLIDAGAGCNLVPGISIIQHANKNRNLIFQFKDDVLGLQSFPVSIVEDGIETYNIIGLNLRKYLETFLYVENVCSPEDPINFDVDDVIHQVEDQRLEFLDTWGFTQKN